jgi:hypothetical protein
MATLQDISNTVDDLQKAGAEPAKIEAYLQSVGMDRNTYVAAVDAARAGKVDARSTGRKVFDYISGLAANFDQGVTLGGADEILGGVEALGQKLMGHSGDLGDLYEKNRAAEAGIASDFESQNPYAAAAARTAGGVAVPGVGAVKALPTAIEGAGLMRQVAGSGGLGGAAGAVSGYLSADPGARDEGALLGGALGAAAGAAAPAAIGGAQSAYRQLREPVERLAQHVQSAVAGTPSVYVPSEAAIAARPARNASSADDKILQALQRDNLSPALVREALARAHASGQPLGIVDAAGQNTAGLGRATVTLPGRGRDYATQALNTRSEAAPGRIVRNAEQLAGQRATDAAAQGDAIIAARDQASGPVYRRAEATGGLMSNDLVEQLSSSPIYREIHEGARTELNAVARNGEEIAPLFDARGRVVRAPTIRDVDMIKRGFDARLYHAKGPVIDRANSYQKMSLGPMEGRRQELLAAADDAVPEYREARDTFSGPTTAAEALEQGRTMFKAQTPSVAEVREAMRDMNPGDAELFRAGALSSLRDRIRASSMRGADITKKVFGLDNSTERDAIAQLFGNGDRFREFENQMTNERAMHRTRGHMLGNSQTANKLAEAADAGDDVPQRITEAVNTARGGPMAWASAAFGKARAPFVEARNSEVAGQLFNFDRAQAADAFLSRLDELDRLRRAEQTRRSTLAPVVPAAERNRHRDQSRQ